MSKYNNILEYFNLTTSIIHSLRIRRNKGIIFTLTSNDHFEYLIPRNPRLNLLFLLAFYIEEKHGFKVYTEGFRVLLLNRRVIGCKSINLYPIV